MFLLLIVTASTLENWQQDQIATSPQIIRRHHHYAPRLTGPYHFLTNFNRYESRQNHLVFSGTPLYTYLKKHPINCIDYGENLREIYGFSKAEMPGNVFAYHQTGVLALLKNAEGEKAGTYDFGDGYPESKHTSRQKLCFLGCLLQHTIASTNANPLVKAIAQNLQNIACTFRVDTNDDEHASNTVADDDSDDTELVDNDEWPEIVYFSWDRYQPNFPIMRPIAISHKETINRLHARLTGEFLNEEDRQDYEVKLADCVFKHYKPHNKETFVEHMREYMTESRAIRAAVKIIENGFDF